MFFKIDNELLIVHYEIVRVINHKQHIGPLISVNRDAAGYLSDDPVEFRPAIQ